MEYIKLKDKNGNKINIGDIVEYANKYQYIVCFGEYNENPSNCAKAIIIGFYLKEIKTGEIEKLYSIDGIIAKFPAHCAESEEGIENFKLVKVGVNI